MKKIKLNYKVKKQLEWYSFIIISLIAVVLFTYYPMTKAVAYSFSDVSAIGAIEKFVGTKNYENLLLHTTFLKAGANTFILAFMGLLSIPIGFVLACLINSIGRGKTQGFFRVCFYLPHIIAGVSVVMILQQVLKSNDGIFNQFLSLFCKGKVTIGWLSDPKYAKIGATIISIWSGLGYCILINLASLQAIPGELYEAAAVDGAGGLRQVLYITIPNMRPCFLFMFLTSMMSGLARFSDLYMLGGNTAIGKPAGSLQTMMMFIYQYGFEELDFGMSSAAAILLFLASFVFSIVSAVNSGFFKDE